ncbi:MAG: hypothetical protein JSW20_06600 [Nitrospiraceae bacterium]|nr:MAG: hypothetical protein JSW20_06600 [Nitrospiraceae bacterium]
MMHKILIVAAFLALFRCAHHMKLAEEPVRTIYMVESTDNDPVSQHAPVFMTYNHQEKHNRIGRPSAVHKENGDEKIFIDVDDPIMYFMVRNFTTEKDSYTNYIYRVHFPGVPFSLIPYHLTAGKNTGLITVVTVDSENRTVLITTVHTCGCYLAVIPTTNLSDDAFPDTWTGKKLKVYGERLPPRLEYTDITRHRLLIHLRPEVHRVMDLHVIEDQNIAMNDRLISIDTRLAHMDDLMKIPIDGSFTSFYYSEGPMKGFVKGSVKVWESLFLSLISLDLFVGTDKIYVIRLSPAILSIQV